MPLPRCLALSVVACAFSAGLSTVAPPAYAQSDGDRATARSLGVDGQQALENKDYKAAEDRFRRAESLVHAPTLMLGLARSLAGLGRYVEAQETYNRIIREGLPPTAPEVFKKALAEARKEVDAAGQKIGGVTIAVRTVGGAEVPNAKVVLDGLAVNTASLGVRRSIDPGSHVLQASADGFKPIELRFDVAAGSSVDQPVTLEAEPSTPLATGPAGPGSGAEPTSTGSEQPPTPGPTRGARAVLPWVAFGVGAAGLGVGGVAGFLAMGKHSDLASRCAGTVCAYPGASDDIDSYHTIATISTIGFIVGGVGVAAGAILLVTQPTGESAGAPAHLPQARLRVVPVVGPGSIGAAGAW